MNALGVILAGGGAARMGHDKALVPVLGRPMIEWMATALGLVTDHLHHVAGPEPSRNQCVPDNHQGRVPWPGLATALRIARQALRLCS